MIDFDATVLAACQNTFARPIIVTPTASQPGVAAFPARGIWSERPIDVQLEDGSVMNSRGLTLGLRRSEFTVMVHQGDTIDIPAAGSMPRVGLCAVDEVNSDGQGDAQLILKKIGA